MTRLLDEVDDLLTRLRTGNDAFARHYAGAGAAAQPVHTLYWGAHRFRADSFARLGAAAVASFATYAEDPAQLARAFELPDDALARAVHERVRDKLARAPIEDLRIDFEDGYGIRPDDEEDADAEACARALASAIAAGEASPASGIRIKPLTSANMRRSVATLDRFVTTLVEAHGRVPDGFRITLPKVQMVEHVEVAVELLGRLERRLGLPDGAVPLEFMVEVTQVLFDPHGRFTLPLLVRAGGPRLVAVALGVYDFTASCGITAAWQSIDHPMCDLARGLMMLACAGTHVQLCDGSTNVLPVEPDQGVASGDELLRRNREAIWRAWRLSHAHVRRSLIGGWVQGWDLHPAQIPVRFAANYCFYLEALAAASTRLSDYLARATAATDGAAVLDDAATGQALLAFFHRARACGAVGDAELLAAGLRRDELEQRSFVELLAGRRGATQRVLG
jgi:hypothetical protein